MSLYRRQNSKIWWYNFVVRGRKIQASSGHTNRRLAERRERQHHEAAIDGKPFGPDEEGIPTFRIAMARFLAAAKMKYRDHPVTAKRLDTCSKPLVRYFKNRSLDAIRSADAFAYREWRATTPSKVTKRLLRPATLNRENSAARLMFAFVNDERAERNLPALRDPFAKCKKLKEHNRQNKVVTYDEQRRYLTAVSEPTRSIMSLMFETGCRPSEITSLLRGDIDLNAGNPRLFVRRGKTESAIRDVPLSATAVQVLQRRLAVTTGAALFPGKTADEPIAVIDRGAHRRGCKRAGVPFFKPYVARHSHATRLAQSGCDTSTLASLLGHRGTGTLERYVHPEERHRNAAAKRLETYNVAAEIAEHERNTEKGGKSGESSLQKSLQ
jgi:integrase